MLKTKNLTTLFSIFAVTLFVNLIFLMSITFREKVPSTAVRFAFEDRELPQSLKLKSFAIDEDKLKNSSHKQIFFIESHIEGLRNLSNPRQVCSVESAARLNPDMDIYLYLTTDQAGVTVNRTPLLDVLLSYPNIHVRYINLTEYTRGTKLEGFYEKYPVYNTSFPVEHLSDSLRMLMLNKYGGLYLDLDVISLVPVRVIDRLNFVCMEGNNIFGNTQIRLNLDVGKKFTDAYLDYVVKHFDARGWTSNGPDMLTTTFRSLCPEENLREHSTGMCGNLTTFRYEKCFPMHYRYYKKYYEEGYASEVFEALRKTGAFFIHFWNKLLTFEKKNYRMATNSSIAYVQLAKVYCPKTIAVIDVL